ncbi:hypothetical protein GCM10027277_43230 [Pseudoduganella ginsengisoli]|uniref:DUF4064 domain-containing protein n=1 Tax=Pseudoduganella ginsengisoli TaxID=1462440 RepID=A0A6L6Q6K9_9BURK|nr:hypothetical protein [Pseudoduganella ginsengisoli]MTW05074.1 hypothetical protein [Pseudoduganella ginsengisoli]
MKKFIAIAILAILAICAWNAIDTNGMTVNIDGDEIHGPLGALLGLVFGGLGMVIAAIAVTCAAVFVGCVFAGLGVLMVVALALVGIILAAVIAPFTLPLLIPAAIVWFIMSRNRKHREKAAYEHAV